MTPEVVLIIYCAIVALASLAGGWLPSLMRMTHTRTQLLMSFVGGFMLGVGLLHLLPHAVVELSHAEPAGARLDMAVGWTLVGLLTMFFLIRAFRFHHHGPVEPDDRPAGAASDGPAHDHRHPADGAAHRYSWIGVALGLTLHALSDGMALAAGVAADQHHDLTLPLYGLAPFLAVLLHKPLDAFPITTLMASGGWSSQAQGLVNIAYALVCPIGAGLFYVGVAQFGQLQHMALGCALAFSAGVFLCISLGDLLPEIHFHAHDRLKLSAALVLGVAAAYGIGFLEGEHLHTPHGQPSDDHGHSHDAGHSHD